MDIPEDAKAAVVAAADLAARSGAKDFEVGYLDDTDHCQDARWYANCTYRGARIGVDEQPSPWHAAEGLAQRLLDGAQCTNC